MKCKVILHSVFLLSIDDWISFTNEMLEELFLFLMKSFFFRFIVNFNDEKYYFAYFLQVNLRGFNNSLASFGHTGINWFTMIIRLCKKSFSCQIKYKEKLSKKLKLSGFDSFVQY